MMSVLRANVLGSYRSLLRTRSKLFAGDLEALVKSRLNIREAFLANKDIPDDEIEEQIKVAVETDDFLKKGVVQAVLSEREEDVYRVKIKKHTKLFDNVPLKNVNVVDLNTYQVPNKFKKNS